MGGIEATGITLSYGVQGWRRTKINMPQEGVDLLNKLMTEYLYKCLTNHFS
jgi:hypothetical protein